MRVILVCLGLLSTLLVSSAVDAQSPPPPFASGPQRWVLARAVGPAANAVALTTTWSARQNGRRTGEVELSRLDHTGAMDTAVRIHRGEAMLATMAVREDAALVVMWNGGSQPFVEVHTVALDASARPSRPRRAIRRAVSDGYTPMAAAACPTPDGFAVLWQEQGARDPNDIRAWMTRVSRDGIVRAEPSRVAVPWGIAAMIHDGRGFHVALYFGQAANSTRICLVTLSDVGAPEQHPWWVTPAEAVSEVILARNGDGGIEIFYRGGANGDALESVVSTGVGQWGGEPGAPRAHGTIAAGALFAPRVCPTGRVTIERWPASAPARPRT